jgi:hypothetical protein
MNTVDVSSDQVTESGPRTADPTFVHALRDVVLRPDAFYARLSPRAGYRRPLVFALVLVVFSTVMAWLVKGADDPVGTGLVGPFLFDLVLFPATVGLLHLAVLALARPTQQGLEASFRVMAYSQVLQLVDWVPVVGLYVGAVYGIVLGIVGVRHLHRTTLARSVAIFGLALLVVAAVGAGVLLAIA